MIEVVINTSFEAQHYWPEAPADVAFLKSIHRHVFHVRATQRVSHTNREIEIISFKKKLHEGLLDFVRAREQDPRWSCEDVACYLMKEFRLTSCEVLEDGENGACAYER